jgi:hypothetical protein
VKIAEGVVAFGRSVLGLDQGLGPLELVWDRLGVVQKVSPMATADVFQLFMDTKAENMRFQQDVAAGTSSNWADVAARFGCGPQGLQMVFGSRLAVLREVLRDRYRVEGEPAFVREERAEGARTARQLMKAQAELKALDVERRALGSFLDASLLQRAKKATARVRELERELDALRARIKSGGFDDYDPALPSDETSGPSAA